MNKNQVRYLLISVIFLGAFLRFYNLGGESFWLDEGATALAIKKYTPLEIIGNIMEKGQILPAYYMYNDNLPAYYLFLSGWVRMFGMSEFSFRAFSALLSTLALIAVFYLARYLFNEKIALLATFLSAINLTLLWYAQEARQYSYLLFLSMLSVIFLLKFIREGKAKHAVGLVIVNALIIYSHLPWAIFIFFEGLYAMYITCIDYTRKKILHKKIIIAFLIMGILYLPILGRALFNTTETVDLFGRPGLGQVARFGVQLSTWLYPSAGMRQEIYGSTFNFTIFEWLLLLSVLFTAIIAGAMFLIGIRKSFYSRSSAIFLLFMLFVPIIFALALSRIHPVLTIFQIKLVIYTIPAFLIFVSAGIIKTKIRKILVLIIIILSILPTYSYYANIDKGQFREAAHFLPQDEPIFANIETSQVVLKYYYGEKDNLIGVKNLDELKSHLEGLDSFWVLLTFTKYSDPDNSIKSFLDENYVTLEDKKDFFDIRLLHYSKRRIGEGA